MNEPVWVTEEDCLSFHDKLLARFGGASGVRDKGQGSVALGIGQTAKRLRLRKTVALRSGGRLRAWHRQESSIHRRQQAEWFSGGYPVP